MVEHKYIVLHLLLLFCNGAWFSWDVILEQNTIISTIFLFYYDFFMIILSFVQLTVQFNGMQCNAKKKKKVSGCVCKAFRFPRNMEKLSALLCSFWPFKAKRDDMIFWFQDMPWVSQSNWVYGTLFHSVYQAKCRIAWKISSTPLLHELRYHPLSTALSKVHCKNNVRPILKLKSMSLFDESL